MGLVTGVVTFLIIWWTVLFMVLPIGVRGHDEAGEAAPDGGDAGAPTDPQLWRKARLTTLIACAVFAPVFIVVHFGLIDLQSLPIGPRIGPVDPQ